MKLEKKNYFRRLRIIPGLERSVWNGSYYESEEEAGKYDSSL
jgi:hypothetical protein